MFIKQLRGHPNDPYKLEADCKFLNYFHVPKVKNLQMLPSLQKEVVSGPEHVVDTFSFQDLQFQDLFAIGRIQDPGGRVFVKANDPGTVFVETNGLYLILLRGGAADDVGLHPREVDSEDLGPLGLPAVPEQNKAPRFRYVEGEFAEFEIELRQSESMLFIQKMGKVYSLDDKGMVDQK